MKKISIIICVILVAMLFAGCVEIVSEKPIDAEYIAAYDTMETVYGYKYDWWNGELKYLPELKMVHHDEEYKVQYERVWSDGTLDTYWLTVNKTEYENTLQKIDKGGNNNG